MAATYYPIPREELEAWMADNGFSEIEPFKKERVFARHLNDRQRVIVYTTLGVGAETVRETGGESGKRRESIRAIGQYKGRDGGWFAAKTPEEKAKGGKGSTFVRRTHNWGANLAKAVAKREGALTGGAPTPAPTPDRAPEIPAEAETAQGDTTLTGPMIHPRHDTPGGMATLGFRMPEGPDQLWAMPDDQALFLALEIATFYRNWQTPSGGREPFRQVLESWVEGVHSYGGLRPKQRDWLLGSLERVLPQAWIRDRVVSQVGEPSPEPVSVGETPEAPQPPAVVDDDDDCLPEVPSKYQLGKMSDAQVLHLAQCIGNLNPPGWDEDLVIGRFEGQPPRDYVASFTDDMDRFGSLSKGKRSRLVSIVNRFGGVLREAPQPPRAPVDEPLPPEPGGDRRMTEDPALLAALKEARERLGWSGALIRQTAVNIGVGENPGRWTVSEGRQMLAYMLAQAGEVGGGVPAEPEKVRVQTRADVVEVTAEAAAWAAGSLLGGHPATPQQAAFIAHPGGPALVDAIAGSGKTSTVMRRMLALWRSGQDMSRVLAITFTTAARSDMGRKWNELADAFDAPKWSQKGSGKGPDIRTIHSLGYKLVKAAGTRLSPDVPDRRREPPDATLRGLTPQEVEEARKLAKRALMPQILREGFKALKIYDEAQDDMRHAMDYYSATQPGAPAVPLDAHIRAEEKAIYGAVPGEGDQGPPRMGPMEFLAKADANLKDDGRITFLGMLQQALALFDGSPAKARKLSGMYDHIIVDEAQDVSPLQLAIAFRMAGVEAGSSPNLSLVGDSVGQSIYSFQGGRPELIQAYATQAVRYPLTVNFRSVGNIVYAAGRLIDRPEQPIDGKPDGPPIEAMSFPDPASESAAVVDLLVEAHGTGTPWSSMAILYRTRMFSALPQLYLWQRGVPHIVERGEIFWESAAPRIALNTLRFALQPTLKGFSAIANKPFRGFRKGFAGEARRVFGKAGANPDLWDVLDADQWSSQYHWGLESMSDDMEALERSMGSAGDAVRAIRDFTDVKGRALGEPRKGKERDDDWVEAWSQLVAAASAFEGDVERFVQMVDDAIRDARKAARLKDLPPQQREAALLEMFGKDGAVTMTTAHSSKGREWPHVAIVGWQGGIFPLDRFMRERGAEGEAEERRIAYVAITRAKETLLLTASEGDEPDVDNPVSGSGGLSPYTEAVVGGATMAPPAVSPWVDDYERWVLAGAPSGQAPFIVRPKER